MQTNVTKANTRYFSHNKQTIIATRRAAQATGRFTALVFSAVDAFGTPTTPGWFLTVCN